ncbi:MEKHLA domain-containing protein [Pannus brasiliensis CCIBt3594]|uniref:MEKHLA domain-containing protein n=1 Tax=Pannus brasiliensis CCIBt3594 TaxID=1427578 RepID=A0AAW9QSA3_9CHRO
MGQNIEIWQDPAIIAWTELLLDSYERLLGRSLLPPEWTALERSHALYHAPFVVVSHGTEANPIFNYGNRVALDLWGLTWEELIQFPSRATVGEDTLSESERAKMLARVRKTGYIDDYRGIRVSKTGRRFRIDNAIVWNTIDRDGIYRGQAATFASWTFLE